MEYSCFKSYIRFVTVGGSKWEPPLLYMYARRRGFHYARAQSITTTAGNVSRSLRNRTSSHPVRASRNNRALQLTTPNPAPEAYHNHSSRMVAHILRPTKYSENAISTRGGDGGRREIAARIWRRRRLL